MGEPVKTFISLGASAAGNPDGMIQPIRVPSRVDVNRGQSLVAKISSPAFTIPEQFLTLTKKRKSRTISVSASSRNTEFHADQAIQSARAIVSMMITDWHVQEIRTLNFNGINNRWNYWIDGEKLQEIHHLNQPTRYGKDVAILHITLMLQ